ncbi:hypothetical protein GXY_14198 [Novacetimonas hansenii ATCC 23769]|uniref:Uncharacterized protein n=1 Tax=Novacetimonas hansenii ATCC 23769 TaxID=714995 RepID=D5QI59_NOVHA|nr:hypothetical protein GXY_14198 [Novacetimonas hansenii ATCC 23769]
MGGIFFAPFLPLPSGLGECLHSGCGAFRPPACADGGSYFCHKTVTDI